MAERDARGVEKEAIRVRHGCVPVSEFGNSGQAVKVVTSYRSADVIAVDSELIRSASKWLELEQIVRAVARDATIGRPCRPAGFVDGETWYAIARTSDRRIDHPILACEVPTDERDVRLRNAPLAERACERDVRVECLGDDERARCRLIEPVDEEWSHSA